MFTLRVARLRSGVLAAQSPSGAAEAGADRGAPRRPKVMAAGAPRRPKVMAVSSGGGHWVELRRIRPAFADMEVFYASTDPSAAAGLGARHYTIRNVTRRDRAGFLVLLAQVVRILLRERPEVVVTTGAAPGLLALAAAKLLLRSRTIWIDSIASAETLSLSARLARPVSDAWLVQWPHLAHPEGPEFWGAVL